MYVLDSSALIELLRDSPAGKRIASKLENIPAITTAFTVNEILIGAKGATKKAIEKMLEGIEVLDFDKDAAIKSASIEEELSGRGSMINKTDIFIAGICIIKNMSIVTLDNHFKRIPGLKTVPL